MAAASSSTQKAPAVRTSSTNPSSSEPKRSFLGLFPKGRDSRQKPFSNREITLITSDNHQTPSEDQILVMFRRLFEGNEPVINGDGTVTVYLPGGELSFFVHQS